MSDFSLPNWARPPTPSKKFSNRFLTPKTRFVSIMVTNPKIDVLHFVFLKLPRAKGKMDIYKCPKNVQKWGVKISRISGLSAILNGIFLTGLYLKYGLANAQIIGFINH